MPDPTIAKLTAEIVRLKHEIGVLAERLTAAEGERFNRACELWEEANPNAESVSASELMAFEKSLVDEAMWPV